MRYAGSKWTKRDVAAAAATSATTKDGVSPSVILSAPPPPAAAPQAKQQQQQQHPAPPPLTRDDASFLAQGLEFVYDDHGAGIDLGQLNDLFEKVGFPRRDPRRLAAALTGGAAGGKGGGKGAEEAELVKRRLAAVRAYVSSPGEGDDEPPFPPPPVGGGFDAPPEAGPGSLASWVPELAGPSFAAQARGKGLLGFPRE